MKDQSNSTELPLKSFREELGISRRELSITLGITERSLCSIELGHAIPKLQTLVALADFYKKPLKVMVKAVGIDVSTIPDDTPPTKSPETKKTKK